MKDREKDGRFSKGNTFAEGLTTSGRPPVFKTAQEMEAKAIEYFEGLTIKVGEETIMHPATITGICLFLGFNSRQGFYEYKNRSEFSDIVTRIQLTVENSYEKGLYTKFSQGSQFALKNMGWKDKTEVDQTITKNPPTIHINKKSDKKQKK